MVDPMGSVIEFMPWQQRFFQDDSRIKIGCVHRQGGKDFVSAAEAVDDALQSGSAWYIISITQRQADQTFAKCRQIADIFKLAARHKGEVTLSEREYVEYDRQLDHSFRCTARTLHLPGGGTVTALPGRDPDTLAGLTGNIIFTEFGLFPNGGYDHWRVIFPLITRGYSIIVISTPRGKNTKFFELVSNPETYSVHFQTLEQSVAEGFVLRDNNGNECSIEQFKKLYGDATGYLREYMCEFSGDLEALIKWAQLLAAARDYPVEILEVTDGAGWKADFFGGLVSITGRPEGGWDVARHSDLSVLWVNVTKDGIKRLSHLVIMRRCSFAIQREIVSAFMDSNAAGVGCGDATGLGMDSNETLATKYGERWLPVTFTATSKTELGSLARTAFDDNDQVIPPLEGKTKWIGTDIYSVQADRSGDRTKLVETSNPLIPESHADIFFAFALCRKAAGIQFAQPFISVH